MFRYRFALEAYGPKSREYAESLVHDAPSRPLSRYGPEETTEAVDCLQLHQLLGAFCAASTPKDASAAQTWLSEPSTRVNNTLPRHPRATKKRQRTA